MTIDDGPYGAADEVEVTGTSAQVVVLGSLHLDILVHATDRPRKGETLPGSAWGYKAGGKGGNQAVAAAQLATSSSTTRTCFIGLTDSLEAAAATKNTPRGSLQPYLRGWSASYGDHPTGRGPRHTLDAEW